jgi:5-oxoprolinase (ATP-hydrolysing)
MSSSHPVNDVAGYQEEWLFGIDVGGTFTDAVARDPKGQLHVRKMLSHGVFRGKSRNLDKVRVLANDPGNGHFALEIAEHDVPEHFFTGSTVRILNRQFKILRHEGRHIEVAPCPDESRRGWALSEITDETHDMSHDIYTIALPIPAPAALVYWILGRPINSEVESLTVNLGTTRATNGILERKGAPCALLITEGFSDLPEIRDTCRPHLFRMEESSTKHLHTQVVGIEERIDSGGQIISPLDTKEAQAALSHVPRGHAIAICLLNSFKNPCHEQALRDLALEMGFQHVVASTDIVPFMGFLSRIDTTICEAYTAPLIQAYLKEIQAALPNGKINLMAWFPAANSSQKTAF